MASTAAAGWAHGELALQREGYATGVLDRLEHELDTMLFDAMPAILSVEHLPDAALGDKELRAELRAQAIEELTAHEAQLDQAHAALILEAEERALIAEGVPASPPAPAATAHGAARRQRVREPEPEPEPRPQDVAQMDGPGELRAHTAQELEALEQQLDHAHARLAQVTGQPRPDVDFVVAEIGEGSDLRAHTIQELEALEQQLDHAHARLAQDAGELRSGSEKNGDATAPVTPPISAAREPLALAELRAQLRAAEEASRASSLQNEQLLRGAHEANTKHEAAVAAMRAEIEGLRSKHAEALAEALANAAEAAQAQVAEANAQATDDRERAIAALQDRTSSVQETQPSEKRRQLELQAAVATAVMAAEQEADRLRLALAELRTTRQVEALHKESAPSPVGKKKKAVDVAVGDLRVVEVQESEWAEAGGIAGEEGEGQMMYQDAAPSALGSAAAPAAATGGNSANPMPNTALQAQIVKMAAELDRLRAEERQSRQQAEDRIRELETEVASLRTDTSRRLEAADAAHAAALAAARVQAQVHATADKDQAMATMSSEMAAAEQAAAQATDRLRAEERQSRQQAEDRIRELETEVASLRTDTSR
eukprot:COSAG02_NODE_650_length_18912_cov_23.728698_1_plen_600_part_10